MLIDFELNKHLLQKSIDGGGGGKVVWHWGETISLTWTSVNIACNLDESEGKYISVSFTLFSS